MASAAGRQDSRGDGTRFISLEGRGPRDRFWGVVAVVMIVVAVLFVVAVVSGSLLDVAPRSGGGESPPATSQSAR